jgi:hypothetical protein
MKTIGVFHQTYYDREPFKFVFSNFRKHFPNSPYLIYSDTGDDFSKYTDEYTFYKNSKIRLHGTGPNALWYDNWYKWHEYFQRLKETCEICDTDYILIMEDDVLITEKFEITDDFDICGANAPLTPYIVNYIENKIGKKINPHYGLCGGAIFNARKFLKNYEQILENLHNYHYEYSNNLQEPIAIVGDGNFVIQFNLLGLEYTCSTWMLNKIIIHPYKGYVRHTN